MRREKAFHPERLKLLAGPLGYLVPATVCIEFSCALTFDMLLWPLSLFLLLAASVIWLKAFDAFNAIVVTGVVPLIPVPLIHFGGSVLMLIGLLVLAEAGPGIFFSPLILILTFFIYFGMLSWLTPVEKLPKPAGPLLSGRFVWLFLLGSLAVFASFLSGTKIAHFLFRSFMLGIVSFMGTAVLLSFASDLWQAAYFRTFGRLSKVAAVLVIIAFLFLYQFL